jgi:hypothetical protein
MKMRKIFMLRHSLYECLCEERERYTQHSSNLRALLKQKCLH